MVTNRIVTRGLGPSRGAAGRAGPVTQGYGGIAGAIVIEIKPEEPYRVLHGRSSPDHGEPREEVITVRARLVTVNDDVPVKDIKGMVRIIKGDGDPRVAVERFERGSPSLAERIKVTIKLLRW